jgi:dihydrofolate reductase
MRAVVAYELVSVDGVAEAPETFLFDFDEAMYENLRQVIEAQDTVLLGRRMYDEWAEYWPTSDDQPFADFINTVTKHVATSLPLGDDPWTNSHAIEESVPDFVRELKAGEGRDIGVHGSLTLARSLLEVGLVDDLHLVVAPCIAGTGRKLFAGTSDLRRLTLAASASSPTGSVMQHYQLDAAS